MTSSTRRLAATAAVAAVALTSACSSKLSAGAPPPTTVAPTTTIAGAATPAQTKAADYRAQLTYLMVEHVYLLGRVTGEIVAAGGIPPSTTTSASPTTAAASSSSSSTASSTTSTTIAVTTTTSAALSVPGGDDAASALDKNSHDIADLLGQAQGYGADFSSAFYALWTARISDVADYATAKATTDAAGAKTAIAALATNATAIATLVHQTNKYVAVNTASQPGTGLADELGPDNAAVTAFVDAQASKSTSAVSALVTAAELMRHASVILAGAAAKLDPDQFPGTPTGTAANLRASVTSALVEHVELTALATDQLASGKAADPEIAAVASNTAQLANIVIVNFGDQASQDFTKLWGGYAASLEGYAKAKGGSGTAPDLSGVGQQVGAFFGAQAPQLSATLIGSDSQQMVDALKAVIDASAAQSPSVTSLRVAAAFVPKLASDIAEGIAEDKPAQYLP